jgi:ferrous iron transport protein A
MRHNHSFIPHPGHEHIQPDNIPLCELQTGERGVVTGIRGGQRLMCRMVSMGFTPGVEITLLQNYGHGPLIAFLRGAHVALGRGEAGHIIVQRMVK